MAAFPPPNAGAPQAPQPQAPPQGAQSSSPLASLANRGGSGNSGSLLQMILTFLAGAGMGEVTNNIHKLLNGMGGGRGAKGGQSAQQPHTGGPQVTANGPPGGASVSQGAAQQMDPQQLQMIMQMLAQRGQQPPQQ